MTKILRLPAVKERTGLSRSTIYNYMSRGLFPSAIDLGPRAIGWTEEDIDEWIEERIQRSLTEARFEVTSEYEEVKL